MNVDRANTLRRMLMGFATCMLAAVLGCGGSDAVPDELASFQEAMKAVEAGDKAKGMELLTECIDAKPTHYAYLERAKLYYDQKKVPEAIKDCQAGLALQPDHAELRWYISELEKPEDKRFKGPAGIPPRSRK
jgi:hypothetical protein